jgi:hypothetical protein
MYILTLEMCSLILGEGIVYKMHSLTRIEFKALFKISVSFLKPRMNDLVVMREMLQIFGGTSGLRVNYAKSSTTLIHRDEHDASLVADQGIPHQVSRTATCGP